MEGLTFVRVDKGDSGRLAALLALMIPYIDEMDSHSSDGEPTPASAIERYTGSMVDKQGLPDRYLELCLYEDAAVGFYHAKVDHEGDRGSVKPGYGYIMEFYITPEHRLKGFGRAMFDRICSHFVAEGAERIWLTTDPVTGKPFWERLGFGFHGEVSPENGQDILEMDIEGQHRWPVDS